MGAALSAVNTELEESSANSAGWHHNSMIQVGDGKEIVVKRVVGGSKEVVVLVVVYQFDRRIKVKDA